MIRAALQYAARLKWPVFPVRAIVDGRCECQRPRCGDAGKHPRISGWQNEATVEGPRIRRWWTTWPNDGIGIHTSEFWVLDVDPRHGGDESLRALEETNGPLPLTPRQLTGGGGVHHLFRPDPAIRNRSRFMPGLDTRHRGGFIVAAPSDHVSGRSYAWDVDAHPLEVPIAEAPRWLLEIVTAGIADPGRATSPETRVGLLRVGVDEGNRDNTLTRIAGHLLRRYVDPYVVLELLLAWNSRRCRPPLEPHDLERIVTSVMRMEIRRRGIAA